MIQRRSALGCALALACGAAGTPAIAQSYPAKPLQLYVAFAAGGAGDTVARIVARKVTESMGQPVVIENRPSPVVAVLTVAKARPDGYAMVMAGSGTALTSALFKTLPYDLMKDFKHVSTMATFDLALLASSTSGFNKAEDVIAYARANPGKLNIGTVRVGSTQNLAAEMFRSMSGIQATIVPYKTTAEVMSGLRSGDVQVGLEILSPVLGLVTGKTLKVLAMTSKKRFPGLPDVPTLAEGALPGFDASSWNGVSVPAATPDAVVRRLSREISKAVGGADVQKEFQLLGVVAAGSTPEQMTERMAADIAKWKGVIEKAGIPLQ
ncbi:MAG: tripartite tricarboxylate transporter substrate-binding protein [Pseudomonadota bacterium]